MKTIELTGVALDWAVAQCEGFKPEYWDDDRLCFTDDWGADFEPSCDWLQGGKIIEREKISLYFDFDSPWIAECGWARRTGETPLVAAMRCYVASKLGDELDVPEELINYA